MDLLNSLGVTWHDDASEDEWKHVGFFMQVGMLFKREVTHNWRNKKGVGARFVFTAFLSLLVGSVFFQVGGEGSYYDPSVS